MVSRVRRILNPILVISSVVLFVTGVVLLLRVWINGVRELHEVSSIAFMVASVVHVLVNWRALFASLRSVWTFAVTAVVCLATMMPMILSDGERDRVGQLAMDLPDISLPAPRKDGGKPLMQALRERRSTRAFDTRKLPDGVVSDLLWAAFGISRPDSGRRTAPSARNWQEVEVYAITAEGAYLYDAKENRLRAVLKGDLRKLTGIQPFAATVPLNLVFVADFSKETGVPLEDKILYSATDTGFISQNVYLFCASEGLATVVRGAVDRKSLAQALRLPENKRVILTQAVGYPGQ